MSARQLWLMRIVFVWGAVGAGFCLGAGFGSFMIWWWQLESLDSSWLFAAMAAICGYLLGRAEPSLFADTETHLRVAKRYRP